MVIWITGISGAGKTTICQSLWGLLKPSLPELAVLDGDVVRKVFGNDLGYTEKERVRQIKRIQSIATMMDEQGFVVLVAALYGNNELLDWNRKNFNDYYEIYVDAPLWLVKERDPKELYAKASNGDMDNVVGLDIPWHIPTSSDMVIDATKSDTPEEISMKVIESISRLTKAYKKV